MSAVVTALSLESTGGAAPLGRWAAAGVPAELEADRPPEQRGIERDAVRLMLVRPGAVTHHRFHDLPTLLARGDLLVVNTSATLPAALTARDDHGAVLPVHLSGSLDNGDWVVEVRRADNSGPDRSRRPGATLTLPCHVLLTLLARHPDPSAAASRLWRASAAPAPQLPAYLAAHGRPIRYRHIAIEQPLAAFQNVYAEVPGSAEMASAGRPITERLLAVLRAGGIAVAPIVLHAGVSSAEAHEPPAPERFEVPPDTAARVTATHAAGGRVVAVGTTVVRALETLARADGSVEAGSGWTDLVLDGHRRSRAVSGLVTGLHLPESSHLRLLQTVAGAPAVAAAYAAAREQRYLWHEFGDSMLFLP